MYDYECMFTLGKPWISERHSSTGQLPKNPATDKLWIQTEQLGSRSNLVFQLLSLEIEFNWKTGFVFANYCQEVSVD